MSPALPSSTASASKNLATGDVCGGGAGELWLGLPSELPPTPCAGGLKPSATHSLLTPSSVRVPSLPDPCALFGAPGSSINVILRPVHTNHHFQFHADGVPHPCYSGSLLHAAVEALVLPEGHHDRARGERRALRGGRGRTERRNCSGGRERGCVCERELQSDPAHLRLNIRFNFSSISMSNTNTKKP